MPDLKHSAFEAAAVPGKSSVRVSLQVGIGKMTVEIPATDASMIAGIILRAARDAASGNAAATRESSGQKISLKALTVVSPTGYGAGPGRKQDSLILHFQFGDATLGIELGKEELGKYGQRLMALAAEGTRQ